MNMHKSVLALASVCFLLGVSACGSGNSSAEEAQSSPAATQYQSKGAQEKSLVVYFSRTGSNYWHGGQKNLRVGNTAILAKEIARQTGADLYKIVPKNPYSDDYMDTVARNMQEERDGTRPEIADELPDVSKYNVVYLGSPVWNSQRPMIMRTFIEQVQWSGQQIRPFVTHAMSDMAGIDKDYQDDISNAAVTKGLAVMGSDVPANPGNDDSQISKNAAQQVSDWIKKLDTAK